MAGAMPKRPNMKALEAKWQTRWTEWADHRFDRASPSPIFSIDDVHWYSEEVTGIGFDAGSTTLYFTGTNSYHGYGLLEIKYRTKCMEYEVQSDTGDPLQFVSIEG